jgi:hypothetical protein
MRWVCVRALSMSHEALKFLMGSTFHPPYHIGGDATHVKYIAEESM